jgi:hypothetical protein
VLTLGATIIPQLDALIKPIGENVVAREIRLQKEGVIPIPTPPTILPNEDPATRYAQKALAALFGDVPTKEEEVIHIDANLIPHSVE